MAEVFLAMQEGIGGFEKLVVVKRIFAQFCEDERFIRMFLDEARLAASIRHQNVVHILDIGHDDDGYFIVMEYLSGESVAYVFEALRARHETIPPEMVCRVGASIAAGLHYAHTATDAAGHPQPIVHRDVTPSNLIVTYNGVVKIVDFGVAKATLGEGHTRAGALKGKMSYLSPEQIDDRDIDGRADVFQLGICLHEMLTGRRLFHGDSDHQKMMAVMERRIPPPSEINASVPRAVDNVILGALARDPDKRPQSADILRRQLEGALGEIKRAASEHDLGEWMRQTLPERHTERLTLERECVAQMRTGESSSRSKSASLPPLSGGTGRKTPTMATVLERKKSQNPATGTSTATGLSPRGWAYAGITAVALAAISLGAFHFAGEDDNAVGAHLGESASARSDDPPADVKVQPLVEPEPPAPDTVRISIHTVPDTATISIDGVDMGTGEYSAEYLKDGRTRVVEVSAPGFETRQIEVKGEPIDEVVLLKPMEPDTANDTVAARDGKSSTQGRRESRRRAASTSPSRDKRKSEASADEPKKVNKTKDDWLDKRRTDNKNPWK